MLIKTCYIAKLSNGITFLGAINSIERVAKGIKKHIEIKAPSQSEEGQNLFVCAKNHILKRI